MKGGVADSDWPKKATSGLAIQDGYFQTTARPVEDCSPLPVLSVFSFADLWD